MKSSTVSSPVKEKKTTGVTKRKRRVPSPKIECFHFPYFAHQQLDPGVFPVCEWDPILRDGIHPVVVSNSNLV